jgi:hypothetical protein
VGLKEHQNLAQLLREKLSPQVYLWVNAYKREVDYYTPENINVFTTIDPLFPLNNQVYQTLGKPCNTGHRVISVNQDGMVQRCHFIKETIANIYEPNFEESLFPRNCQKEECRCYIGYVHLPALNLDKIYGDRLLERIPLSNT